MVKEIESEQELNQLLAEQPKVLLKFSATWCGPCRAVAPVVDGLAPKYPDITFRGADLDAQGSIASRYEVTAVPTLVYIHNGKEVDRVLGANVAGIKENLEKLSQLS